jgi:hypothetical protein
MSDTIILFFEGVLASFVAGILLVILGGFISRKMRWILTATLGRLLDIDIEYVFRKIPEFEEDLKRELGRAKFIYLFTGRGNDLQQETYTGVFNRRQRDKISQFRILLPDPKLKPGATDWLAQRNDELAAIDPPFGKGALRDQIEALVKFLDTYVSSGVVELKFYNYPHIGRILVTDRVAYFVPYRKDAHGRDSIKIKYRAGGDMYEWFLRFFNQLWDSA